MAESYKNVNEYAFEITKHTIHFHDDASIYSLSHTQNHLLTAGSDKNIRCWHISLSEKKKSNILCYPENSSVFIEYCTALEMHHSANVVKSNQDLIVCGSIFGEIIAAKEIGCKFEKCIIKGPDGDSCNDIVFVRKNLIVCGFESGKLLSYEIEENPEYFNQDSTEPQNTEIQQSLDDSEKENTIKPKKKRIKIKKIQEYLLFNLLYSSKPHNLAIQGLTFNQKYNILTTFSKDRTAKHFYVSKKLTFLDKIKKFADEQEMILFRKFSYSQNDEFLFIGACNGKYLNILNIPFSYNNIIGKIGPFEAHVSVIKEFGSRKKDEKNKFDKNDKIDLQKIKENWLALNKIIDTQETGDFEIQKDNDEHNNVFDNIHQKSLKNVLQEKEIEIQNNFTFIPENITSLDPDIEQIKADKQLNKNCDKMEILNDTENFEIKTEILDSNTISVKNVDNLLFFAVKNSLYCMDRSEIIFKMENITYKGITDICFYKNIVFVSSADGLISSVRFYE